MSQLEASISMRRTQHQPVGNVLYANTVPLPRVTLQLFMMCPRNLTFPEYVDSTTIYQSFAKKVSLVKCEAELIMCDLNNDGRLAEDEMEQYVSDLVPRIVALRDVAETVLPFYCCTATRRIFWDLDPYSRGVIRIDALLQSAVMDEWVRLQLMTEDSPQNWFGGFVTQQLYDKFLMLDARNEGTLNADNLKRYKKGLPTVSDDGLPIDVSPLSTLFIDRFFETNVMMPNSEMDYRKFVDFVIAVEMLPQCSRPHFFWNILDMEGVGYLTPMVVNCFFRETYAKLISAGLDVPARETVVQEVFDLVPTAEPLRITREEFLSCPQAGLFASLVIDCLSFWTYENREAR
ncbi:protein phosphatase 2 (formerly 2A), regulatory subunit B'' [Strigomonas culicis]|nr:protein phosphatase 2 (formerly 2A), regulatory subunit B'' [Strigomonas culicis]|eukprot:EPY22238.1 protein phosphatase 2 (formerly 2A), regulatory subunit B'' [Strigomonas culicis]